MTYIERLNDFNQWLESNTLPGNAQLLFFRLLNIFNRAGWPEQVQVDTRRLTLLADCEKDAAYRARDKLCNAGFLSYRKGKKGSPTTYFLSDRTTETTTETDFLSRFLSDKTTETATHIKTKTKTSFSSIEEKECGADKPPKRPRFLPPTVEQVAEYVKQRGSRVDPQGFIDFYEAKGWMIGKTPMRDWKAACRNAERWERWNQSGQKGGTENDYWA